jgi:site-specific recombinase XerD
MKHPPEVVPADVLLWPDRLRARKKSAATVAFKLSVVRSFFEYLKAAGAVPLNPASTRLVSPPELPSEPSGRALSAREVRYLRASSVKWSHGRWTLRCKVKGGQGGGLAAAEGREGGVG